MQAVASGPRRTERTIAVVTVTMPLSHWEAISAIVDARATQLGPSMPSVGRLVRDMAEPIRDAIEGARRAAAQ